MPVDLHTLRETLIEELPGEDAHVAMSPIGRGRSSEALKHASHIRESAVALVIYKSPEGLASILIQRPTYNGVHSGQICLPGGKREKGERDLIQTAIRECVEETGLKKHHLRHIGELTPVFIPVSGYHVFPYIFEYSGVLDFYPDPREVDEMLPFNLKQLLLRDTLQKTDIHLQDERILRDVPHFAIHKRVVWGATALILHEFKEVLLKAKGKQSQDHD